MKACSNETYKQNFAFIAEFYGDDFNIQLESQLATFRILYSEKASEQPSITSMRNVLRSLSCAQRSMLDMIGQGFHILLVMPATNCTCERSFSAFRRIKSYLRNNMIQVRLNHLLLLHCHQDQTDSLDLKEIGNFFISSNNTRKTVCKISLIFN